MNTYFISNKKNHAKIDLICAMPLYYNFCLLAWEPSFALKQRFIYKIQPIQLRTSNQAKNIL